MQAYASNPLTGESITRELVETFLGQWNKAEMTECNQYAFSLHSRLFCTSAAQISDMYKHRKAASPKYVTESTYARPIGRAAHHGSGHNPNEFLWCVHADITNACKTLDDMTRKVLGMKYVAGYNIDTIASSLGISRYKVDKLQDKGILRIVEILDGMV